jgi:hypothetical protein
MKKSKPFIITLMHEFKHFQAGAVRHIDHLHQHIYIGMVKHRDNSDLLHLIYDIALAE